MNIKKFCISEGNKFSSKEYDTTETYGLQKKDAEKTLNKNAEKLFELQDKLYAENKHSLLIVLQAMDAAGKDSLIKHVMSGLNPQGTRVKAFKRPSEEEINHDYLWRVHKELPERGHIGIFNRSYYEEVLVVRVNNLIKEQKIPEDLIGDNIWEKRYREINHFEKYLHENGVVIIKFFLNVSKDKQKERLLERINDPAKNWKFEVSDMCTRDNFEKFKKYYEETINATSTEHSPWYVLPADKKWFTRLAASEIILSVLEKINPQYPELNDKQKKELDECRIILEENK
jgi:PPK2 family polyphosphate:nucleotide phosphotransferase